MINLTFFNIYIECHVYICDFHREQAWVRWFKNSKHGVGTEERVAVIAMLRKMALANDEKVYQGLKTQLQQMDAWKKNINLQKWLENTWFSEYKVKLNEN